MVGNRKEAVGQNLGDVVQTDSVPEEVLLIRSLLVQKGYSLSGRTDFLGVPIMYRYTKDIDASDLPSFLPKEALDKVQSYLSRLEPSSPRGGYETFCSCRATIYLSKDGLKGTSYSYSCSFVSLVGSDYLPLWFFLDVSGSMTGPHPEGVPEGFASGSRIYVPFSYRVRADGRPFRSRGIEDSTSTLLSLLDSFKDNPEFLLSSDVYLTSSTPTPSRKEGEGSGGRPSSYLYIGTVGDLLSGFLGDQEKDTEEEEEEE